MIGRSRIVLIFAIACGAGTAAQPPVRDNAQAVAGTASISGTVFVAGEAKQPARRVRVTLSNVAGTSPGQTTTTDDGGTFTFHRLTPGAYELQAFRPAYLRASYGASRPDRAGTPVVVKDGEAVANLAMTIARGGVITGIVRDIGGRPVSGMNVRVLKLGYNAVTGERTLGAPSTGSVRPTDDRGEYRAYGLPPGGYLVVVVPNVSGRGHEDIRQLTAAEVRQAVQAARTGGSTAKVKPGQPTLAPSSARVNYAPIFHPGATDIGAATPIALGVGEERAGVDVSIQLVPTATISGTISSSTGALPPSLSVRLVPAGPQTEMLAGAGLRGLSAQPRPDGTYVLAGVAPGAYTVKAIIGGGRGAAPTNAPTQWAAADVLVNGQDLDVPLTLQPGVPINGRVVFEGSRPTAAELQSLAFMLVPPGSGGQVQASGGGRVDAEGRFTFAGVTPDTYRFVTTWNAPAARDKWSIKASTANGREAFEAPLRVSPNETVEWTVTYTDKPTSLTGVFQDSSGRAAADYYILVFSSDRKHWMPGSRRVRMTRPSTDGVFTVKGLPPGEYFLAALADLETGEWNDPTLLDQLAGSSTKVTLEEGKTTTQDYRIGAAAEVPR